MGSRTLDRTGFGANSTKICSWLSAVWLFLAVSADAIATPYYADVSLPDPHSRFVQSLYAQPVQADFTDDTQLLLLQQEFAQIRYTADADALLDFIGRKVMADLLGQPLPLDGIRTARELIVADRRFQARESLEDLRKRVADKLTVRFVTSTGSELGWGNNKYLGDSLWVQPSSRYNLRLQTVMTWKHPISEMTFHATLPVSSAVDPLYLDCQPNIFKREQRPYQPGTTVETICTIRYSTLSADVVRSAVSAAMRGETALKYFGLTLQVPGVSFQYHSFRVAEPFYLFAPGVYERMGKEADQRIRQTTCFDLGTCMREARRANLALHLLKVLIVAAAIVGGLFTIAGALRRRAPILFGFTAVVFIGAFILAASVPEHAGLGALLYYAPALYLSLPWSRLDFPLVGFRNDASIAGIAVFGGLLLNLAILGALMLWRRPPRGEKSLGTPPSANREGHYHP